MNKFTACLVLFIGLSSCDKDPGKISVINQLPGAELKNVKWGNLILDNQLLPGEESRVVKIGTNHFNIDLPESHPVSFQMTVNSSTVFLETTETFPLDFEESIQITIDSSTQVYNPLMNQ